jgi:hypothetical protein
MHAVKKYHSSKQKLFEASKELDVEIKLLYLRSETLGGLHLNEAFGIG